MRVTLEEKAKLVEKACKQLINELSDAMESLDGLPDQKTHDEYDTIHVRLILVSKVETELSRIYAQSAALNWDVEVNKLRAKAAVEDKAVEVMDKPTFKSPTSSFMSRPEIETKVRSMSVEEVYELRVWEKLQKDVYYLQDVIRTYQQQANRARRDIDTRLKILQMKY